MTKDLKDPVLEALRVSAEIMQVVRENGVVDSTKLSLAENANRLAIEAVKNAPAAETLNDSGINTDDFFRAVRMPDGSAILVVDKGELCPHIRQFDLVSYRDGNVYEGICPILLAKVPDFWEKDHVKAAELFHKEITGPGGRKHRRGMSLNTELMELMNSIFDPRNGRRGNRF